MASYDNGYQLVREAFERISPFIEKTRLVKSVTFSNTFGCSLFLKMENEQRTGSFKLRGAYNKLIQKQNTNTSVVTSSTGNHGLACLDAMQKFDIKGKIIVPKIISSVKKEKLESKGANLHYHGTDCEESETYGRKLGESNESVEYISPYNDIDIIAGQGTIAVEILNDIPDLDYIFVSVGGGGLISGVASYIKKANPQVKIVGCQPEASPVMLESIKAGEIVEWESKPTLSEGTAGGVERNSITFPLCKDLVDHWEVVSEEDIKWGIDFMWRTERAMVEGAAGMALAAARNMANDIKGNKVCVIMCGGNINKSIVEEIVSEFA
jgi:threonine dehydratase